MKYRLRQNRKRGGWVVTCPHRVCRKRRYRKHDLGGFPCYRSAAGEANVVSLMQHERGDWRRRERRRDRPASAGCVTRSSGWRSSSASWRKRKNCSRRLVAELSRYFDTAPSSKCPAKNSLRCLRGTRNALARSTRNRDDGLRLDGPDCGYTFAAATPNRLSARLPSASRGTNRRTLPRSRCRGIWVKNDLGFLCALCAFFAAVLCHHHRCPIRENPLFSGRTSRPTGVCP